MAKLDKKKLIANRSRRYYLMIFALPVLLSVVGIGLYQIYQNKFVKHITYTTAPVQAATSNQSVQLKSKGLSSLCGTISAQKLSQVTDIPFEGSESQRGDAPQADRTVASCTYKVRDWQQHSIRSLSTVAHNFKEQKIAQEYLDNLKGGAAKSVDLMGKRAFYSDAAHQLLFQKDSTVIIVTVAKSKADSNNIEAIAVKIAKEIFKSI